MYNNFCILCVISAGKKVSAGASSRDEPAAQDISSQQLQEGDTVKTSRQSYLSSGKLTFLLPGFMAKSATKGWVVTTHH